MWPVKIETDFAHNVKRVSPHLGVLLVASIALGFGVLIMNAAQEVQEAAFAASVPKIGGSIILTSRTPVRYGDTLSYRQSVDDVYGGSGEAYVTVTCFQDDGVVFDRAVPVGKKIYLYDQVGEVYDWDGLSASCTMALMYRRIGSVGPELHLIDSHSFDVLERSY